MGEKPKRVVLLGKNRADSVCAVRQMDAEIHTRENTYTPR